MSSQKEAIPQCLEEQRSGGAALRLAVGCSDHITAGASLSETITNRKVTTQTGYCPVSPSLSSKSTGSRVFFA